MEFRLRFANILKVSTEELTVVVGKKLSGNSTDEELVKEFVSKYKNLEAVVVTLAENGSFAYERNSRSFAGSKAIPTEVVSTVGAGTFGAAFLVAYVLGEDLKTCLKKGTERSTFVVSHQEAIPFEDESI